MPDVAVFMTFLVTLTAMHQRPGAGDVTDGLAQRLGSVEHEQHPLLWVEPTLDQVGQQRGRDRRVLGRSLPQRQRDLGPVSGDPERDDMRRGGQVDPVDHHHRQL